MTTHFELYGTDEPPVARQSYTLGPWSFSVEDGALRHILLHGKEAIRAVALLVRDRDWGTISPEISDFKAVQDAATLDLSYLATFTTLQAKLTVEITIKVTADNLQMSAEGQVEGTFETNRAGFTVLHPISDVAGQPVQVAHSDGTQSDSVFPDLIAPWQPFMDISALSHQVGDAVVTCQFRGDIFEMEDQRQWGDASYKTYNRPLAKPWPYVLEQGETLRQSVDLSWVSRPETRTSKPKPSSVQTTFPDLALVITAEDAQRLARQPDDLSRVNPQRLLCHFDATLGDTAAQFDAFAKAQAACPNQLFDLELICECAADPVPELHELAAQMQASGFAPDSILICPSVDRQSTPPGSAWPACPPLTDIHTAAAQAFPNAKRGGGMVSFFPELNRKRPPIGMLDFVSHGLCPIVHAADDLSVIETLEAIPHITRSVRSIVTDKEYRIGPATIAMRQNPYGTRTIPNPHQTRTCMADDDPRHRAKFGAAYVIGLATAMATSGVTVWTPAALYGARGIIADKGQWPIVDALKCLAQLAGRPVYEAAISDGLARLRVGELDIMANLTPHQIDDLGPYEWREIPSS